MNSQGFGGCYYYEYIDDFFWIAALDQQISQQALMIGFQNSFLIMVLVPAIGIILTLLLGRPKTS